MISPEQDMFEIHNMSGYNEEIVCAITTSGKQGLRREIGCKKGLEVYGMLDEGIGLKGTYTDRWMTKLKVHFKQGLLIYGNDPGTIQERTRGRRSVFLSRVRKRVRRPYSCSGRMPFLYGINTFSRAHYYRNNRKLYYRKDFESWGCGAKAIPTLWRRKWPDEARVAVNWIRKTSLRQVWQKRNSDWP